MLQYGLIGRHTGASFRRAVPNMDFQPLYVVISAKL
jgi:hypothetical protein